MKQVLFIGGPLDGRLEEIEEELSYVRGRFPLHNSMKDEEYEYRLIRLRSGEREFWLGLAPGIDADEAMTRLIQKYHNSSPLPGGAR